MTFSAVSTNALTGSAAVRRVNLADDGRIFFSENYFIYQSNGAGSATAFSQTDLVGPVVASPGSLAKQNSWADGISFAWTPATDAVTSDSGLNYELFKAPAGTDLSTLAKIYLDGELISRNAGVSAGAFYPGDSNSYRIALVVGDKAGNRSIYTAVDAITGISPSAQTWSQQSADTGMGNVINQTIQQLGSTLYLVGGILGTTPFTVQNKVYKSTDGINWSEQAQSGSVAERFQHGAAVLNSKLWIAGGTNASATLLNDVAYTTDGATWTTVTARAAFSARSNPEMVAFNGKLWIIGGNAGSGYLADVWYSSNGSAWTRATSDAGFKAGSAMRVVVLGSYMYAIGEGANQEVWRSSDGVSWSKLLTSRPFGSSNNFSVVAHSSRIYLVGGSTTDVWASPDGIVWEEISTGSTFPGREDHVSVSFNNKIWVYHGINAGY